MFPPWIGQAHRRSGRVSYMVQDGTVSANSITMHCEMFMPLTCDLGGTQPDIVQDICMSWNVSGAGCVE